MIIGVDELKKRIDGKIGLVVDSNKKKVRKKLIESPDEIIWIEGVSVDLRLNKLYKYLNRDNIGILNINKRKVPEVVELEIDSPVIISEGYYLANTIEWINNHIDLVGDVRTRTTLFRIGGILITSIVSPNYQGNLTFGLLIQRPLEIQRTVRFASITFHKIGGKSLPYSGLWQGGKVIGEENIS